MRKILLTLLTTLLCSVTAWGANGDVLFSQNFNSATAVNYAANTLVSINGSSSNNIFGNTAATQFTSVYGAKKSNAGFGINANSTYNYSGVFGVYSNNTGYYYCLAKTTDFSATPTTALKISITMTLKGLNGTNSAAVLGFAVGSGFSDGVNMNSQKTDSIHSAFSFNNHTTNHVITSYNSTTSISSTNKVTDDTEFTLTWIINNTGENLTYDNPSGSGTTTLANDKFDVWVGTTKYVNAQDANHGDQRIRQLIIGDPAGKKHEFKLNSITVTDLTPATSCSTPAAPTAVTAGSTTSSGTTLTITDAANAASYDIYYSTSSTAPDGETEATTTSTSKTKALTGLTASTTYYVWVRSVCDSTHKSSWTALTGSTFTTDAACTDPELTITLN